jgi:hypothetical protein
MKYRGITSTLLMPGDISEINWSNLSISDGIVPWIEIKYTTTDDVVKDAIVISADQNFTTKLPKYKSGTKFTYNTGFKHNATAIDVFYPRFKIHGILTEVTSVFLKNYMQPFTNTPESDGGGTYRTPTDWTVNSAVQNQGGFGGWIGDNGTGSSGNGLGMQSG